MTEIVIQVPDENEPGFLKRWMALERYRELLKEGNANQEFFENL